MRRALGGILLALWVGAAFGADTPSALAARQADAKKQQAELRSRIGALQKEIDSQESSRRDAASDLKASESAISNIDRRLDELAHQKKQAGDELEKLSGQIANQKKVMAQRQAELADQLRARYASGLSPWTALLSGDDPQAIGRDLGYLSYISRAQAQAVSALRAAIDDLAALQGRAAARKKELTDIESETADQKSRLETQKQEREKVLARIEDQLHKQRAQADTLERNDKRLGNLITGLDSEIARLAEEARKAEEKRKAEAARKAEEARQAALEKRRALEQQRKAAQEAEKAAQARARREQDEEQARAARLQVEQARAAARAAEQAERDNAAAQSQPQPHPQPAVKPTAPAEQPESAAVLPPEGGFQGLHKGLRQPVPGEIQGKFGAQRPDGGIWRGIVIRADAGTPVHVVAPGRVVYANWLNGFGNIIIVDHGDKYLSVYAYNQSLLKKVGDVLHGGDIIARVGATGGQVEPGLYLEIRHNGLPVNPLLWLTR